MITYLGGIIADEELEWFKENSIATIPISSDTHQKSIIQGLRCHEKTQVLYTTPCGFFPTRFKAAFVSEKIIDDQTIRLRSCNFPFLRIIYNIRSQVKGLTQSIENGTDAIVCYMPFYERMKAIQLVKKKYPNISIIVVVPDLVEHSFSKEGTVIRRFCVRWLRKIEANRVNNMAKCVDGFVYLAEQMKGKFGKGKPFIIQEAIYNFVRINEKTEICNNNDLFTFTYCGKLTVTNGVDRLIEAFGKLKFENARLCLCGDGELLDFATENANKDHRIYVTGHVSHDEVLSIQKRSTVLVNPRYTSIENAAYSFPSKLIEYLACGRPVITSHLAGIPRDYDDYVFYIDDDSPESLLRLMDSLMHYSKDELNKIGKRNYEFVFNEKSSFAQGKKLVSFIQEIINSHDANKK